MSPYAKFGPDRPSRSAGHRQQTNRHIAFYYVDAFLLAIALKMLASRKRLFLCYHLLQFHVVSRYCLMCMVHDDDDLLCRLFDIITQLVLLFVFLLCPSTL